MSQGAAIRVRVPRNVKAWLDQMNPEERGAVLEAEYMRRVNRELRKHTHRNHERAPRVQVNLPPALLEFIDRERSASTATRARYATADTVITRAEYVRAVLWAFRQLFIDGNVGMVEVEGQVAEA